MYDKFLNLLGQEGFVYEMILSHNIESLRSVGLSVQKAIYIQNMAEYFKLTDINDDRWHIMSDTKIIQALTNIKG